MQSTSQVTISGAILKTLKQAMLSCVRTCTHANMMRRPSDTSKDADA